MPAPKLVYTADNAKTFGGLGIVGTTFEPAFQALAHRIGSLDSKLALDFGCGTGRSSKFVESLGGSCIGVDHNFEMVHEAIQHTSERCQFLHVTGGTLPFQDAIFDVAISVSVFIEIRTINAMIQACKEVARVTKSGGSFFVVSTNPNAFSETYENFSYHAAGPLKSGDLVECIIRTPRGEIRIEDTYWGEEDYGNALAIAGFRIENIEYPKKEEDYRVSPFILLHAVK